MRGGLPTAVPTDPTIYRFYEVLQVYGAAIKELIHEQFGDGIMSAINFSVDIAKKPHPAGDRVVVTFDGKFLPYDGPLRRTDSAQPAPGECAIARLSATTRWFGVAPPSAGDSSACRACMANTYARNRFAIPATAVGKGPHDRIQRTDVEPAPTFTCHQFGGAAPRPKPHVD